MPAPISASNSPTGINSLSGFQNNNVILKGDANWDKSRNSMTSSQRAANPLPKPGSAPTVLTDANIRDKVIPDLVKRSNQIAPPITTNPNGAAKPGDTSNINNTGTSNTSTGTSTDTTATDTTPTDTSGDNYYSDLLKTLGGYTNGGVSTDQGTTDTDTQTDELLKSMQKSIDTNADAQIKSIQDMYDVRKKEMQGVTASQGAELRTALRQAGSRYAPGSAGGAVSANESSNVLRLAQLDAEENKALADVRTARQDGDFKVLEKQLAVAETKRKEKADFRDKIMKEASDENKRIQDAKAKIQENIDKVAEDAAKNGASSDILGAISSSKSVTDAIKMSGNYLQSGTGDLGDYIQYKRDTEAKGLVPKDFSTYKDEELYKTEAIKNSARINADNANTSSDKTQQKLEQQYRGVLSKEFASRTGALGVENAKVNQANHLNSLITQYYDPKTGDYNIPTSQYAELVMGLANLVAPTGSAEADRAALMAKTASGDLKGAIQYITGEPQNGNTQDIIKNLIDSVDRQALTATQNRDAALQNMRDQAPTDLEQSRIDKLNKSTNMVAYAGQERISKKNIESYVKSHPDDAETVAKLYEVPGATEKDIEDYLRAQGKLQ